MPLKVLCVVDKEKTALDRLAQGVEKYHDNLDYSVVAVHPKRPDAEQLAKFEAEAMDADIIDWQYFRTAELLRQKYGWLHSKKQILTHNNPYSIEESDWNGYDYNVGNNKYITSRLKEITEAPVTHIPITVDTDFWTFNTDWKFNDLSNHAGKYELSGQSTEPAVIMVANRIEGKKGILPVAIAAAELNLKFILVGAISDRDYFYSIMQTSNNIEFHEQVSDEKLRELYYKSTVHVCNSVDGFESGTMPVLEAMLCGVPVLSRPVGHVPELATEENMVVYSGSNEDVEQIMEKLRLMVYDRKLLIKMRENAWNSAKVRSFERRAYMYQKLYREVLHPEQSPVSVIMPIYDKPDVIRKSLNAIANQTYKNIELIVVDDNPASNESLIKDYSRFVGYPVRYINTSSKDNDYGLARARNVGTIEATGDILVYADQRMIMDEDAIEVFVANLKPKTWLYGNKGTKKEFVENFSCVYRKEGIVSGLFNERIDLYGGMSQELRSRIRKQGFQVEYIEGAKATPTGKSSNRWQKKEQIIKMKSRLWKMELE